MRTYKPLSTETWNDLLLLFGEKGACGGCWCMWWRLRNKDYESSRGIKNKSLLKKLVENEEDLGIIGYENNIPIGWCSISPRQKLKRLETSRLFKPIDDIPVWSITCIFVNKAYRNKGISAQLIKNASEYALKKGAKCIEAYPLLPQKDKTPDAFGYVGFKTAFEKSGFKIIKQPSKTRLMMRKCIVNSPV